MKVCISGQAATGVRACILLETDVDWVPFCMEDIGKTKEFMPEDVWEIQISDDFGARRFIVSVNGRDGIDWRQRNLQSLLPKEVFLNVTG